jgi:putative flippase GtrA
MSDGDGRLGDIEALLSGVRFGQFVSVGALGATAETIVVAILTAGYGTLPQVAKAVGAEVSISLMFLVNDRWTFADDGAAGWRALGRRYLKSHLMRAGGLAVGFTVLTVLTSWTDVTLVVAGADLWPTVANAIGIGCGMLLNYLTEGLFTWRVGAE